MADTSWQQLDSLPVLPASLEVQNPKTGELVPASQYEVNWNQFRCFSLMGDTLLLRFRVWHTDPGAPLFRIDSSFLADASLPLGNQPVYNPFRSQGQVADFGGLDYNGTFARGISFGNNQNLVLNSSFNLQLAGEIGDGIELLAAITDENIPVQPEGNTQQLREFDKIFIQLKKGSSRLIAGDYEINRPTGYFMNYFKKLQGATFETTQPVLGGQLQARASAALARGKFARNTILGQEGNQGPYRLEGAEGELFIIILSGTEKVYIDGVLLERGQDADYIINYNRGDLTFTNQQLITKDSRIIVEFEYNDQSYLRSLAALNTELQYDRWKVYLNAYTEQDGRNRLGEGPLSEFEQNVLRDAGDDPFKAVVPSIDTVGSNADPITYVQIDSFFNGILYRDVLVFAAPGSTEAPLYTARFTDVGEGNGNYVRPPSTANGFVYEWVAPDPDLGPQGRYEPVVRLVPPNQLQLFTGGTEYKLGETGLVKGELAVSKNDLNRFSNIDADDDYGYAGYLYYDQEFQLSQSWKLNAIAQYEHLTENFEDLNPYRPPEFTRDWSVDRQERLVEDLGQASLQFRNDSLGLSARYGVGTFLRGNSYQGVKHDFDLQFRQNGWEMRGWGSYLTTQATSQQGNFFRPRLQLEKTFEKADNWLIGMYGEREKNAQQIPGGDTLDFSSFYYDLFRVYLEQNSYEQINLGIYYTNRVDFAPVQSDFQGATYAQSVQFKGDWTTTWNKSSRNTVRWDLTYRELEIPDSTLSNQTPASTYLGRLDYGLTLLKGAVRYNNTYQIGSGQEQKIIFFYQAVNPGEGVYKHIDFNEDGQEQNNEFVISPNQDEATHVRVVVYSNEFIRTNNIQFNQSFQLEPKVWWFNKKGVRGLLGRFSTLSNWQIARKAQADGAVEPWNPFNRNIPDSVLVSANELVQNSIFFNRLNQVFTAQFNWSRRESRLLLTTGIERRLTATRAWEANWNIDAQWSLGFSFSEGEDANDQENFPDRNYSLQFWEGRPSLSWLPNKQVRIQGSYRLKQQDNSMELGGEQSQVHDFELVFNYNKAAKAAVSGTITYARVQFDGEVNSPVGFAMLNNLQPGENYLWNITFDRQLARNIRLSLSYEGRKTGEARIVHVGRAQVAATF